MSGNNYTCRDKYYNYGSYLRSRGYDREICNLVADIENGNINIGPIDPGSCSSGEPTTINNDVVINPCDNNINTGTLLINGADTDNISLNVAADGLFNGDVTIRGDLNVAGYVKDISTVSIYESLEIDTYPSFLGDSFAIYQSQAGTEGNIQSMWTDTSANTTGVNDWKKSLVFGIDGNAGTDGATDQPGHTRMLRGATLCNPPSSLIDITIPTVDSDVALDVFGGLQVYEGNDSAPAVIDIYNGSLNIYDGVNENIHFDSTGEGFMAGMLEVNDISVNSHAYIYDLSVVNLMTVGTTTTYISTAEISANNIIVDNLTVNDTFTIDDLSVNDISVNNIHIYDDFQVSKDILFNGLGSHDISFNTTSGQSGRIINNGKIEIAAGNDISVDTSGNIIFNKNPRVDIYATPYINFGTAKSVLKMRPVDQNLDNTTPSTLLNCPFIPIPPSSPAPPYYSNYPSGTFPSSSPDIAISPDFFRNCIMEFSVSLDCSFNSTSSGLRCFLENGATTLNMDSRSVSGLTYGNLVFGPVSYYTTNDYSYVADINITDTLNVKLERMGAVGEVYDIKNPRLTMTTTHIEKS
jgi:hypothetical protein